MRLFFAIELPPHVQATLAKLRPSDENRDYRWVDPTLLHLTLAFLGEQPEARLEALRDAGGLATSGASPGSLTLGRAGSFGSRREPRVLWVDLADDLDALLALHARLATALKQADFPVQERPFRPHITLARRREAATGGAPQGWPPSLQKRDNTFPLDRLTLFQSRLSNHGPTYIPLDTFPLTG
jgi:2'-5' RNA ligase